MAAAKKKSRSTRWHRADTPFEDLDPGEQTAHEIVVEFGDLEPSVARIMDADLTAAQRQHAISLFQASLGSPGDPHRDPRRAIDAARALRE
jgi:hypothetical protein